DWNLYEAASVPLKVVKFGTPYVYEVYNMAAPLGQSQQQQSQAQSQQQQSQQQSHQSHYQQAPVSRVSMCSSRDQRSQGSRPSLSAASANAAGAANMYSPPAPSPSYPSTKLKQRSGLNSAPASTPNQPQQRLAAALASSAPTPPESSSNKPSSSEATNGRIGTNSSPAGLYDLMQTLSRISEKERSIIMVALEKITGGNEELPSISESSSSSGVTGAIAPGIAIASPRQSRSRSRLAPAPSPASRLPSAKAGGHQSRAAAAAAIAATAQFACADGVPRLSVSADNGISVADSASGSENGGTSRSSAGDEKDAPSGSSSTSSRQRAKGAGRPSGDEFGAATSPLPGGKIRLRTRPLTSMACCNRRQSSPFIDSRGVSMEQNIESATPSPTSFMSPVIPELPDMPAATSNAALRVAEHAAMAAAHQTHARKLSNRKSDSALTTATRSMRAVENNLFYRDSVDHA
ncbi:hypothetical protein GGI08_009016, partial [Coemansia sp. S2]